MNAHGAYPAPDSAGVAQGVAALPGVAADSLGALPSFADSLALQADSLTSLLPAAGPMPAAAADTLAVTAERMFGAASYIPRPGLEAVAQGLAAPSLTDSLIFKLVVLLCFAGYCITLYLYRQQAYTLVGVFRSKLYVENLLGERNYTFDNFLNSVVSLGVLTLSLAAVKAADMLAGADMAAALPGWVVFALAPVAWAILGLTFLYQTVALRIAGALTFSRKFTSRLRYLRKMIFSVAAVLLVPLLLMFSMATGNGAATVMVIILAVLVIVAAFFLGRTYMLFVDEKISKLYWFLYLCAVEIFPVTLLLLSVRKMLS